MSSAASSKAWVRKSKSSSAVNDRAEASSRRIAHSVSFSLRDSGPSLGAGAADPGPSRGAGAADPVVSFASKPSSTQSTARICVAETSVTPHTPSVSVSNFIHCKLCLCDHPPREMVQLSDCRCLFCAVCTTAYVMTAIEDGDVLRIGCPDGDCPIGDASRIESNQVRQLVDEETYAAYVRLRTLREIDNDPTRTWCPSVGCETVCHVCLMEDPLTGAGGTAPQPITCPTCDLTFCSSCKSGWHEGGNCVDPLSQTSRIEGPESSTRSARRGLLPALLRRGQTTLEMKGVDGQIDVSPIKRCPICHIPIEREEGCAQMMCKHCKHVFCWYCLESLDNDFLLRHYDRGPCKNKLGHSRASVIWHRTQVIGIFAGFGMLLLMASPFLLLAAPCILCCKCKCCKCLDVDDGESFDDPVLPPKATATERDKRLAKALGIRASDEFEYVPTFDSWKMRRRRNRGELVGEESEGFVHVESDAVPAAVTAASPAAAAAAAAPTVSDAHSKENSDSSSTR